jgi:hypothetical protein
MKQTFHLITADVLAHGLAYIARLPIDEKWRITCEQITEEEESRDIQRHTVRAWCSQLGKERGTTQQRQYDLWKYNHVVPIMIRDEKIESMEKLYRLVQDSGDKVIFQEFINRVHIRDLTVKQAWEAMNEFDLLWSSRGIVFTHRRDYERQMNAV